MRNILIPEINPELITILKRNLNGSIKITKELVKQLNGVTLKENSKKISEGLRIIGEEISSIKGEIEEIIGNWKNHTYLFEEYLTKISLDVQNLNKTFDFLKENYLSTQNVNDLLQFIISWNSLKSNIETSIWKIKNPEFPLKPVILIALFFSIVPFLNFFSFALSIYLVQRKDWRDRIFGWISLIIFFIQVINVFQIAF